MKKLRKLMIITLLASIASLFSGCALFNSGSGNSTSEPSSVIFDGFINAEAIDMIVGDVQKPATNYSGLNTIARFTSSAPDVVNVSEAGELTALKQGSATITLTYGTYKDTLLVHSSFGEYVPMLVLEKDVGDRIIVNKNESLNISARIFFNNKYFMAKNVAYEILKEDGTSATQEEAMIEDGMFNAKAVGEYTVNLVAEWSNFSGNGLMKSIVIEATNAIELYVNDGRKTQFGFEPDDIIYTVLEFDGKNWQNEIPFEIVAKKDGQDVTPQIKWQDGDCVEYANDILKGKKAGVAVLELSYEKVKIEISVKVTPVQAKYDGKRMIFSALDGTLELETIFGEDVDIYSAVRIEDGEKTTQYEVEYNTIKGLEGLVTSAGPVDMTLLVSTEQVGYEVDIRAYTKIIKNQADLLHAFQLRTDNSTVNTSGQITVRTNAQDGYYILANDIEYSGTVYSVLSDNTQYLFADYHKLGSKAQNANKSTKIHEMANLHTGGLTGTFDGNGYSIKNFVISEYGLFGLVQGGTIKNVNIENVTFVGRSGSMQMALGASLYNATLENVNISSPKIGADVYAYNSATKTYATEITTSQNGYVIAPRALLSYTVGGTLTMKNCMFTVPEILSSGLMDPTISGKHPSSMGSLFCYITGTKSSEKVTFETNVANTYVVSPVKLGYYLSGLEPKTLAYSYDTNEFVNQFYTDKDKTVMTNNGSYYNQSVAVNVIQSQLTNIVRYDTKEKMVEATNNYDSFTNSGYWKVENGAPIWLKKVQ